MITGARAARKYRRNEFMIPENIATIDIAVKNGNMIRVNSTVSSNLAGSSANFGAMIVDTRNGMKIMASAERPIRSASKPASTSSANLRAAALSPFSSSLENNGTKAVLNAPSANNRRNRFGNRKAA